MAFIRVENGSSRVGHRPANFSQVRRPSSSDTGLHELAQAELVARHGLRPVAGTPIPPYGVPSAPSGSCTTPSRVTNSMTMTRPTAASCGSVS